MSSWDRQKKRFRKRAQRKEWKPPLQVVEVQPSVGICVPSDDHVHAMFMMCLTNMLMQTVTKENSGIGGICLKHIGSSILPHSRYSLVKEALKENVSHLLFLDSDMTFPGDTIFRLLAHNVDMVGVNAMSRRPPYNTTAWVGPNERALTRPESTGLQKVWRTGFAVVMIRASVFKQLHPPYFLQEFIPEKDQFRGEDYHFFDKAKAAGFDLYIDHDLSKEVNHIGSFAFNPTLQQPASEGEETTNDAA